MWRAEFADMKFDNPLQATQTIFEVTKSVQTT
jgi:hypothetical protein